MPFDNLLVQRESRIAVLTVQRPTRLNALDASTLDALRQAALDSHHGASVPCVVVTGAGEKAFVAGADLNEIAGDSAEAARLRARGGQHVFDLIEHFGKPGIAGVSVL